MNFIINCCNFIALSKICNLRFFLEEDIQLAEYWQKTSLFDKITLLNDF